MEGDFNRLVLNLDHEQTFTRADACNSSRIVFSGFGSIYVDPWGGACGSLKAKGSC